MDRAAVYKISGGVGAVAVAAVALHYTGQLDHLLRLFGDPQYLVATAEGYQELGVFVLLGAQLLNIVFAPIPGQAIGVAYGILYGVYWGTFFGMIGTTVGTAIAVVVAKIYGRPIVVSIIGEQRFRKYEEITESADVWPFVILIVLPVIPDDAIAYLAGLTTIRTRRLVIWLSIARFPGMLSLTWFGGGVAAGDWVLLAALTAVITVVSIWVVWKREWIMDTLGDSDGQAAEAE